MRVGACVLAAALALAISASNPHAQAAPLRIAATAPADVRPWDAAVDRMLASGELRTRSSVDDALIPGRAIERYDQFRAGIRVRGGDIVRQTDRGVTVSVFGTIYPEPPVDAAPALSQDDAARVVAERTGVALGGDRLPALLIVPDDAAGARLVYRARVFTESDGIEYWVDARTGAIVHELSAAQRQSYRIASGAGVLGDTKKVSVEELSGTYLADDLLRPPDIRTYDLRGNTSRVLNFLNGRLQLAASDIASSTSLVWPDPVAVDAQAHAGYVYDYYFRRFGRRGLDDKNVRLQGIIHPVRRDAVLSQPGNIVGLFYVNAFYAGDGVMVYGEGLPPNLVTSGDRQHWDYLAGGLDVAGHELTHGVTEFSSNLIYEGESGALNEAFSDIMGTAIEFFYQTPGPGPMQADYLVGEDVVTPGGIRSLANPRAFGDPDHYSRRYTGQNDNGGVHINSTIASHAYYLAIEGGRNATSGISVTGIGQANREQMERVYYRAFTQLMPSGATFALARAVTLQAARDLYGAGSAPERAVTAAWTAVGVN